jgi:hypothetical protein
MVEMMNLKMVMALVACAPLFAQTGAADGSIRGTVQDASGSPVPGASVTARNMENGFERATASTESGEFEVPLLLPGRYGVKIAANGFAPYTQAGVAVQLAKASTLDIRLSLASAQESITVVADASILNTTSSDVSGDINSVAMTNTPLTTRNTFNLGFSPRDTTARGTMNSAIPRSPLGAYSGAHF